MEYLTGIVPLVVSYNFKMNNNYDNFSNRLTKQVKARFLEVEAIYNFDLGDESEIAVCQLLSSILPDKFGICRGFIIAKNGERAGDDIIIYDKLSFPLIRQNNRNDFSLKQQVPIEAVYAYIECKNSIKTDVVLNKAITQVIDVKKLLLKRFLKLNKNYDLKGPIYNGRPRDWPRQEPENINQPFTMIFTREWDEKLKINIPNSINTPDLLILGENHFASQTINLGPDGDKGALFFDSKHFANLRIDKTDNNSFGLGILMLLQALNQIELQQINWIETLNYELSPFK